MKPRKKHLQLSIPSPCQQSWSEMRPEGNGRFCESCQTRVIDFTAMGDAEVARIMAGKDAPKCGRFRDVQLGRPMEITYHRVMPYWPRLAAGAVVLLLAMPHALLAQAPTSTYTWSPTPETAPAPNSAPFVSPSEDSMFVLKGTLVDNERGEPYPGELVSIFDLALETYTDDTGRFALQIPFSQLRDTLKLDVMSGWEAIPVAIPRGQQSLEITIAAAPPIRATLGYVVQTKVPPTLVPIVKKRTTKRAKGE